MSVLNYRIIELIAKNQNTTYPQINWDTQGGSSVHAPSHITCETTTDGYVRPWVLDCVMFRGRRSSEMFVQKRQEQARALLPADALGQVLEVSGADESELYREVKGRGGNPVRSVAAWWVVQGRG